MILIMIKITVYRFCYFLISINEIKIMYHVNNEE